MAQEDQNKTEQPTPFRLDEARKRGEVARSPEVTGMLVLLSFALVILATGAGIARAVAEATGATMSLAGAGATVSTGLLSWLGRVWAPLGQALTPAVLAILVAAVAGNLLQTGPIFSTHPVTPDPRRLNPAAGLKRLFTRRTLWELGKTLAKLLALSLLATMAVMQARRFVGEAAAGLPARLPEQLLSAFWHASIYVLLVLAVLAMLDLMFVRRDYTRRMRMSRRELRDEQKRREGDPEVRSKRKRLQRDLMRKIKALARVGDADVVLTNPTRVAVALQYRPRSMRAPVVLAKGAGFLAARIRAAAHRHGVPLRPAPALARALYRDCSIDAPVSDQHFADLAPIYRELIAGMRARGLV